MKPVTDCYFYGILDLGYVAAREAVNMARALLAGGEGVDILQLRAKGWPAEDVLALARLVRPLCAEVGAPFILNDHPALVSPAGADGAHVGQDDGLLIEARALAGVGTLLGRSTHSVTQALAAREEGADYLGFGPLFATPTKPDYPAIGLADLAEVHAKVSDRPVFCIGGVKPENLDVVLAAGARRVVIVSGLLLATDPARTARAVRVRLAA